MGFLLKSLVVESTATQVILQILSIFFIKHQCFNHNFHSFLFFSIASYFSVQDVFKNTVKQTKKFIPWHLV